MASPKPDFVIPRFDILNNKIITDKARLLFATADSDLAIFTLNIKEESAEVQFYCLKTPGERPNHFILRLYSKDYKIPCLEKSDIRMRIYTPTNTRSGKGLGWFPIGDAMQDGNFISTITQLEYDWKQPKSTIKIVSPLQYILPMLLTPVETDFADEECSKERALDYFYSRLKTVHQKFIAYRTGYIPRDLFYLKPDRRITDDDFLQRLLSRGGYDNTVSPKEQMCQIILSVTSWVTTRCEYQPDFLQLNEGGELDIENFDKCGIVNLKVGDCEDLAWFVSQMLLELQDSLICPPVLQDYVITNCLVQAQAPQFKKNSGNVEITTGVLESLDEEKRIEQSMDCYHMTCILFPVSEFKAMVEKGKKGMPPPVSMVTAKIRDLIAEKEKVHLLIAEGTVCCYPNIFETGLIEPAELDKITNGLKANEQIRCIPVFDNCLNRTGAIYGAIVEVITPYYIGTANQVMTFFPCIAVEGKEYAAPLINHYQNNCNDIMFLPGADVSPVLNDETCRKKMKNEMPLKLFTAADISGEIVGLKGLPWKDKYLKVIQTKEKTQIQDTITEEGTEKNYYYLSKNYNI